MTNRKHLPKTEQSKKELAARKKAVKKVILITFIALAVLIAVYLITGFAANSLKKQRTEKEKAPMTEEDYLTKSFRSYYPVDYDADLSAESDYMSLNRLIMYKSPEGSIYAIDELDAKFLNEGHRFFKKYFDIVIGGKTELYPSLFSKEYRKKPTGFETNPERDFDPQRVYDILITEIARTGIDNSSYKYNGQNCIYGFYKVEFKIYKNSGLFRRDLEEDSVRPLIFELVTLNASTPDEQTFIKDMYSENSILEENNQ